MDTSNLCRRAVGVVALTFLVGAASPLAADAPWVSQRFQADAKAYQAAAAENPNPTGDVEVLYDEAVATLDANKRWTKEYYVVFRILTTKGASNWDSIGCSWAPWYQDRPTIEARVLGADGSIHTLSVDTIKESTDDDNSDKVYSDRHHLGAPLPAVSVGAIVEERTIIKDTQPYFDQGTVERFSFGNNVPTRRSFLRISVPEGQPFLHGVALLPDAKVTKTTANGTTVLTVDQGPMPAWDSYERYLPNDVPRRPAVTVSTAADWRSVAQAYAQVVDKKIGSPGAKILPAVTGLAGSQEDKIGRIVRWMAKEIRYTGIEFGEAALIPHTPQETLGRKYGDCKDKATLMVALLREAGIGAEVALLSSGPGLDTDPALPGFGTFDHAIVHVSGNPGMWIDPTDEFARPGQIPSSDQGRLALLATPGTTGLVTIPKAPGTANLLLEQREVTLPAFGLGTIKETSQGFGSLESSHRSFFAYRQESERKEWASSYADDEYRTKTVESISMTDPSDLSVPFTWTTVVPETPRADTELFDATLWIRYEHLLERLPDWLKTKPDETSTERKGAFLIAQPFVTEIRVTINPPEGFVATVIPSSTVLEFGPARLTETFLQEPSGTVKVVLKLDTVTDVYTAGEAVEARTRFLELLAGDPLEFRFEPKTQVLATEGKVRESMILGRQLADLPGIEHKLRYAWALNGLGLSDAARAEAKKVTALAPQSALAWQVQGILFEGDQVGRTLRPGTDWAATREALSKAHELSPKNNSLAGDVAIIHEYNQDGTRYDAGAPLDTAISLYRSLSPETRKAAGIEANQAYTLFYAGRYAEAAKETAALADPPLALLLACEALVKSPEAAVALAQRKSSNSATRAEALRTAGNMVTNLRQYPQAAALLRAGAQGTAATQANGLANLLANTKVYDPATLDANDPTSVVRQLIAELIQNLKVTDTFRGYLTKDARAIIDQSSETDMVGAIGMAASTLRQRGLFRRTVVDMVMGFMQFRVSGADGQGYRVELSIPGGQAMGFVVVKEDGEFRVADSTSSPGWGGPTLLKRLDAGQTVGTILDWYRDDVPSGNGDDPDSVPAFGRFWKRGMVADTQTMTLAVAMVMTRAKESADAGVERLTALGPKVTDPATKLLVDAAILDGLLLKGRFDRALPLAEAAHQRAPGSRAILLKTLAALAGSHRPDDVKRMADEWLATHGGDREVRRLVPQAYAAAGDHDKAYLQWQLVLSLGRTGTEEWNNAAWNMLYVPGKEKEGLDLALSSFQANQNDSAILHTLACLFAVNGKVNEAKEAMVKAMDTAGVDAPNNDYRLIQGLLAEGAGLTDLAQELFAQVGAPVEASQLETSSYRLAQIHLKALSKK